MEIPTGEEIRKAHAEVQSEGPIAKTTIDLGVLAMKDPILSNIISQMTDSAGVFTSSSPFPLRSLIQGALMAGLNIGLRIGEARRESRQ